VGVEVGVGEGVGSGSTVIVKVTSALVRVMGPPVSSACTSMTYVPLSALSVLSMVNPPCKPSLYTRSMKGGKVDPSSRAAT
jgi:hypothetical protein